MASKRTAARRRRRRQRRSGSRIPAIVFAALFATVAGYLIVRASDDDSTRGPASVGIETSEPETGSTEPDTGGDGDSPSTDASPATDPSNLGQPVQVFSDTLGDLDIDQVIEDWTPVDQPTIPDVTATIDPAWVRNGRITVSLPDGYYWGVPVNTFDEDQRGINFDVRQVFWGDACAARFGVGPDTCLNDYQVLDTPGTQLYPSFLGDVLFVSLAVIERPSTSTNVAVAPATLWSLMSSGEPTSVTVPTGEPQPPSVALAGSPFLLTIVDGSIIAAEGIWIP